MLDDKEKYLKHLQRMLKRNRLRYLQLERKYQKEVINQNQNLNRDAGIKFTYEAKQASRRRLASIQRAAACQRGVVNFWGWKVAQEILQDPKLCISQIKVKETILNGVSYANT